MPHYFGALCPSKSGLMNKYIVKHIVGTDFETNREQIDENEILMVDHKVIPTVWHEQLNWRFPYIKISFVRALLYVLPSTMV